VVPEVAGKVDDHDVRVAFADRDRPREAVVGRAVVHQDDFIIVAGHELRGRGHAPAELLDMRSRLVERGDDRQLHGRTCFM
jgi:hypothetical protein